MEITSAIALKALNVGNDVDLNNYQISPQRAAQELLANQQKNINIQFSIEALKLSVENDPVARIVSILI